MTVSKKILTISSIFLLLTCTVSMAFELKLPSKSSGTESTVDIGSLTKQQDELVKSLSSSLRDLAAAQKIMADALGLKDAAKLAETTANKLKSGDFTGKDEMVKSIANTKDAQNLIDAELKKGTKLSDDSKALLTTSLIPYASGSVGVIVTSKKAAEAVKALTTTTDFTILTKLGNLISIGKEAPNLISSFTSTTGTLISFAKTNGIDTSGIEKAAKQWE